VDQGDGGGLVVVNSSIGRVGLNRNTSTTEGKEPGKGEKMRSWTGRRMVLKRIAMPLKPPSSGIEGE